MLALVVSERIGRIKSKYPSAHPNYEITLTYHQNSWHIHLQTHDDLLLVIDSVDFYMVKPIEGFSIDEIAPGGIYEQRSLFHHR